MTFQKLSTLQCDQRGKEPCGWSLGHLEKGSAFNSYILLWPPVSGILIRSTADSVETIGAVAQLGERLYGIQEVVGSIPIGSISTHLVANWIATSSENEIP